MEKKSGQTAPKTKVRKSKRLPGSRDVDRGYFEDYGSSPFWDIIEDELADLVKNQDIEITTHPDFVIGSLVKRIVESDEIKATKKEEK